MGRTQEEIDVKRLYAGIAMQAITDIKSPTSFGTWREVLRFLKSDWGQLVCGVAGVPAKTIIAEYRLEERVKQEYLMRDDFKSDSSDNELAEKYELPVNVIKYLRKIA